MSRGLGDVYKRQAYPANGIEIMGREHSQSLKGVLGFMGSRFFGKVKPCICRMSMRSSVQVVDKY